MKHFKLENFAEELELNIAGKSDTNKYDNRFAKILFYKKYPQFYRWADRYRKVNWSY